jgi:DNA replication protein DnaC
MLNNPTIEKLQSLRLTGMARAYEEQLGMTGIEELGFAERFGLLVDREMTERENRRLKNRLDRARLRNLAVVEDIDYRIPRGLDRSLFTALCSCQWVRDHQNVLITGAAGLGKNFLACALAHKACREGFSALYHRLPRLLPDLAIAKADGRYAKLLAALVPMSWSSMIGVSIRSATVADAIYLKSSRTATIESQRS